jgi:thiosulfate/3-mercaptopyruvate sulfurtransferase
LSNRANGRRRLAVAFLWALTVVPQLAASGCFTQVSPPNTTPYVSSRSAGHRWILSGPDAAKLLAAGAVVLDVRAVELHAASHPVGALPVTWQEFSRSEDPERGRLLADDDRLTLRLQALGISANIPVVVVGQPLGGWGEDGRLVWMLHTLGHPNSALVDGGLLALTGAGVIMTDQPTQSPTPGDFVVARQADWNIGRDALRDLWLADPPDEVVLVDTREPREFEGATPYGESRGGHVPGAVHLHWSELVNSFGYLLGAETLLGVLAQRGITPDRTIVTYCTGGVRSAWLVTLLTDLGFPQTQNYAGSMWEWSASDPTTYPLE